jgi:hypothetical protein
MYSIEIKNKYMCVRGIEMGRRKVKMGRGSKRGIKDKMGEGIRGTKAGKIRREFLRKSGLNLPLMAIKKLVMAFTKSQSIKFRTATSNSTKS